jgi:hypothetical protein
VLAGRFGGLASRSSGNNNNNNFTNAPLRKMNHANNNNNNKTNASIAPVDPFVCGSMATRNDARLERAIDAGFVAVRTRAPRATACDDAEGPLTRTHARVIEAATHRSLAVRAERNAPFVRASRGSDW